MKRTVLSTLILSSFTLGTTFGGPVIIDGTDANDHGSVSGGVNLNGWEYMQRALENVGGQVGNGNKRVVDLGTTPGGDARNSIVSAFGQSTLVGAGWTLVHIDGDANIGSFLTGGTVGGANLANTGLLYLPTRGLAGGDMTLSELGVINANAIAIQTFVGGAGNPSVGGGLFAMGETGVGAFGWLNTLIPGIVVTDIGGGGSGNNMTLTAAGTAAFPGLTNADLANADPWHEYFSGNLGSLSVLATAPLNNVTRNIVIGGGAGTVITATVPETLPTWFILAFLGGFAFLGARFRKEEVKN